MRSEYCEPPKPRLMTSRGFISSTSVSQRAILEEPAKTMHPDLGGAILSCSSNLRMEGSQSWAWANELEAEACFRSPAPARHTERTTKPRMVLRISWLTGLAMGCKVPLNY